MNSAVLGMVAVIASIQPGWVNSGADNDVGKARPAKHFIAVTVSSPPDSGTAQTTGPDAAARHLSKGSYHLDNGDYEAALAEYTRALDYDPKSWVGFVLRAYLYQLQKKIDWPLMILINRLR